MIRTFNEDTRVKIPATLQFLRIGYNYQSMQDSDIDFNTKIFLNRLKPALVKINGRDFSDSEIRSLLSEIHTLIRNNDLGREFYKRLTDTAAEIKLVDWDCIENNDFAVVDELPFTIEHGTNDGSFRPDINILINGIPLAFLEVKKPNNRGSIQAEFNRMLNARLKNPAYKKYFNLIQVVSFSNNMEYEDEDSDDSEMIKAGSFYTTPNGMKTSFSFFREDERHYFDTYIYSKLDVGFCKDVIKDLGYRPSVFDTQEFQTNNSMDTPCNRFITSLYDHERLLFLIRYGMLYLKGDVPEKHIMRYPQFFATRAILRRLESGNKRGIIWHTQGSGKTELSCYANRVIRDYYAKQNIVTRFFFIVDRLELLRQDNGEFTSRYFSSTNCENKKDFSSQLQTVLPSSCAESIGEFVVVNIQKFESAIPKAKNDYKGKIQRVFFVDEAHRSYALNGEYFKNLILCDPNAIFIALTGTPLLTKKERSNLKFGDYIHKYFYDKSIADGYTLRIKKEKVDTVVRKQVRENLLLQSDEIDFNKSDVYESNAYIENLGKYIERDFKNFRLVNNENTIGGMIVCKSNTQAKKTYQWFDKNSKLKVGLVISDSANPKQEEINKHNQDDFKYHGRPDILIVHFMLTTGYDVSRLKKMYLLRGPQAQNLLQTISRVNRPYKAPTGKTYKFGYITDFVDIEEEYDRTLNDYLKELERDLNNTGDVDNDSYNSLSGLLVDIDTIKQKYDKAVTELAELIDVADNELFSRRISDFNKDALLKVKRLLNTMKDCFTEFMLSNAQEEADKVDINTIKKRLKVTQDRIEFANLTDNPVRMMDIISNEDVVKLVYDFILTSITTIDLSKFNASREAFNETVRKVQEEIKKNRNKDDIRIVRLNEVLRKLFSSMNIQDVSDLDNLTKEMREILKEADDINRENDRLAAIYDDNFAMVKCYQDIILKRPDLSNKEVEQLILIIYDKIKDVIGLETLAVQGREGFIDETKKKVIKPLLKANLYKPLRLKEWIDILLSDMYTNLQNFK